MLGKLYQKKSDLKLKFDSSEKYLRRENERSTSGVVTPEFGASMVRYLKDNESIGSGLEKQGNLNVT